MHDNHRSNVIDIHYDELLHETYNAWLLEIWDEEIWFPKSQCDLDEENKTITIPEWLAEKKGLD